MASTWKAVWITPLAILMLAGASAPAAAQDPLGDGQDNFQVIVEDAAGADLVPGGDLAAAIFLRIDLDDGLLSGSKAEARLTDLFEFYDARLYEPIWVDADGPNYRARALIDALLESGDDALNPVNYDIGTISLLLGVTTPTALADFEIRLSKALLDYGRDLSAGRVEPSEVNSEIAVYPVGPSAAELLTGVLNTESPAVYLASLAPQTPNYARLKEKLAEYREIAAAGDWVTVPEDEVLKPGMSQPRVLILRQRLAQSGHYQDAGAGLKGSAPAALPAGAADPAETYDEALVAAVKLFQDQHGLETDGVIGPGTLAALNVSVADRVATMELNMERRRWMEDDLGREYVFVNLADYELKVVHDDKTVHTARVVIGKPYHRTPVFSERMKYIEINPFWNVPSSIAVNELLPKLRSNPGSVAADGIRIFSGFSDSAAEVSPFSVNWNAYSSGNFPFRLRQDSGDGNALGRIKFMFPNRFNVYLHDTPSKSLFDRTVRSFSHGCVRVEHPRDLAAVLLDGEPSWSRAAIETAINSGKRQVVTLQRPINVHITYLTAWVNKDGSVHFRDDIYGRDTLLREALQRATRAGT